MFTDMCRFIVYY